METCWNPHSHYHMGNSNFMWLFYLSYKYDIDTISRKINVVHFVSLFEENPI